MVVKQLVDTPCHACAGRFSFAVEDERFVVRHSKPFCAAFDAISSTIDALRFAEQCELIIEPL